jgi:hypothetical protein
MSNIESVDVVQIPQAKGRVDFTACAGTSHGEPTQLAAVVRHVLHQAI